MPKRRYKLSDEDTAVISAFVEEKGGTPKWRTANRSLVENAVGMAGKPISRITRQDVYKTRNLIMDSTLKQNYKRRMVYALREFSIWRQILTKDDLPKRGGNFNLPGLILKTKSKRDMLTPENVQTAIDACTNARDRCLIALLWDGSNRPSELLRLNWGDLVADEYGYHFETAGKTMKPRRIRLTTSLPYLEAWRQVYPGKPSGDSPVFVTIRAIGGVYRRWDITAVQAMFKEMRGKTGIKNLKPYTLRPSRITHDVRNHLDSAYIMLKNWGSMDTSMMEVYSHVDEDEEYLDQQALRAAGIKTRAAIRQQQEETKITVPTCPRCGTLNVSGARFCSHCQAALTDEARQSQADLMGSLDEKKYTADDINRAIEVLEKLKQRNTRQNTKH